MLESTITIKHNDASYEMVMTDADSILDAALYEGINLPYSCKHGICGTCRAKLIEGEVEMETSRSLGPGMIEQGFILTCQSHPLTAKIVIDFDYE